MPSVIIVSIVIRSPLTKYPMPEPLKHNCFPSIFVCAVIHLICAATAQGAKIPRVNMVKQSCPDKKP